MRWDALHKRESKCVAQVFSIQPNKHTREPYGNDLRWCLSTATTAAAATTTTAARHLKTTTNDKWQALKMTCASVCLCLADITMNRLKLKQNAVTIVTMHVYAQYVWQWQPNKRHCFLFMCSRSGCARVSLIHTQIHTRRFAVSKLRRDSLAQMCKGDKITVVVCMRSSFYRPLSCPHWYDCYRNSSVGTKPNKSPTIAASVEKCLHFDWKIRRIFFRNLSRFFFVKKKVIFQVKNVDSIHSFSCGLTTNDNICSFNTFAPLF